MLSIWQKNEDLVLLYKNSKNFREELSSILKKKLKKPQDTDYESPSWAFKQAHDNGYNQAVSEILKLLGEE